MSRKAPGGCEHEWQPVEKMRAVYRCPRCRAMGFKKGARVGFGEFVIVPYTCMKCGEPATKYYRVSVSGVRRIGPTCDKHRGGDAND